MTKRTDSLRPFVVQFGSKYLRKGKLVPRSSAHQYDWPSVAKAAAQRYLERNPEAGDFKVIDTRTKSSKELPLQVRVHQADIDRMVGAGLIDISPASDHEPVGNSVLTVRVVVPADARTILAAVTRIKSAAESIGPLKELSVDQFPERVNFMAL